MAFSKSARIWTLLIIDTVFLVIELVVGLMANSLALISDSLHMLNDVLSLVVALYALKLAGQSTRSSKYSYGWQRAEILGALINGVFLLALCFSIGAEALQRLFEAPEVGQPQLVVIVGSLGLLSNIVGLFLFHDHGHSHGGHSHSHGPAAAEEGHSHSVSHKPAKPSAIKAQHSHGSNAEADERSPLLANGNSTSQSKPMNVNGGGDSPFTDEDEDAVNDLLGHPARTREAIVRQAYGAGFGTPRNTDGFGHRRSLSVQSQNRRKNSADPNAAKSPTSETPSSGGHVHSHDHAEGDGHTHEHDHAHGDDHSHDHEGNEHDHSHEDSHGGGGHGHSHGNMNMQGVFLHVLGDALGNVGVIVSGLIIWLTKSPYRFYSDPVISLVITVIIFSSALPLVRSASFILLQGTPSHVPLEKVHSAILRIPNVVSVHDLHIWSLSESKLVASMHILVSSQDEFGKVSNEVRKLLHRFGVHSSTIQPELLDGSSIKPGSTMSRQGSQERLYLPNGEYEISEDGGACTVQCVDDSCVDSACCPPAVTILAQKSNASLKPGDSHAGHSH